MRFRIHREAKAELKEATAWYSEQLVGLGDELLVEVEQAFRRVRESPYTCAMTREQDPSLRASPVRRFPYRVVFRIRSDESLVVAVAHSRRRPDYWKDRI
ncbi:MAG: type II toxin-antitoxin system RelE/ParE family toxin [Phycisphaerae bacterium]